VAPLELSGPQHSWLLFLASFAAKAAANDMPALRAAWAALPSLARRHQWISSSGNGSVAAVEAAALETLASLLPVFVGVPRAIEGLSACHEVRPPAAASLPKLADYRAHNFPPLMAELWAPQLAANPFFGRPAVAAAAVAAAVPASAAAVAAAASRTTHAVVPPICSACLDPDSSSIHRARAHATLGSIYTSTAPALERNLAALHPRLHAFIWQSGYGYAMSTPALVLPEVEAVAVAVLSGLNAPRQLLSHLRGALAIGLPEAFLTELLEHTFEHVWQDEGVYAEAKEIWREFLRGRRARQREKQGAKPPTVEQEENARLHEAFEDQVARSKRLARLGVQHPLFRAGQMLGAGEPDEEGEGEEQGQQQPAKRTKQPQPSLPPPPPSRPAPPPAAASVAASGEDDEQQQSSAGALPLPSDEEVHETMRLLMRKRAREAAAEIAARKAAGLPLSDSATVDVQDRWPVPPHVLDPSGLGMSMGMNGGPPGSAAAAAAGGGLGGLGGGPMAMDGGGGGGGALSFMRGMPSGLDMDMASLSGMADGGFGSAGAGPLRSRL
jgi:hypothetical protein